jgi:hypothetical protein
MFGWSWQTPAADATWAPTEKTRPAIDTRAMGFQRFKVFSFERVSIAAISAVASARQV